jgi:hypothetical protein
MVSRNSSPRPKKSVSLSVMLGTFLVPLSAYAASSLVETSGVAESVTAPDTPVVESAANTAPSIGADLETACGEAGLAMVAAESDGTISQVQQAALDALRGSAPSRGCRFRHLRRPNRWPPRQRLRLRPGIKAWWHRSTTTTTVVTEETTMTKTITAVTAVTMTTRTITGVTGRTTIEPGLDSGTHRPRCPHCRDLRPSRHGDCSPIERFCPRTGRV